MYDIYIIEENDTIDSIAKKLNTDASTISRLNGITPNTKLSSGMSLVVPKMTNPYFDYYIVRKGDNLYQIAKEHNVDYKVLAALNGLDETDYIYPNQTIMLPKNGVRYYLTKENDTLVDLTNKLGTNLNNILSQNSNLYILPGQLLIFRTN